MDTQVEIKPGKYRHYKGNCYEVIGIAHHSETLEKMVVYKALYAIKNLGENSFWVRPLSMFAENVTIDGGEVPRFSFIE